VGGVDDGRELSAECFDIGHHQSRGSGHKAKSPAPSRLGRRKA
jgi:hypothetical protein